MSLDTAIPGLSRSEPALGVELCSCPTGYSAASCQQPALGFWIPQPTVHMTTVGGTIVIKLEGEAQPCHCNQRAVACHPDTGHCLVSITAQLRIDWCNNFPFWQSWRHIRKPDDTYILSPKHFRSEISENVTNVYELLMIFLVFYRLAFIHGSAREGFALH